MTLFLILVNFIAALFALQLLRGDVPGDNTINFGQLFNAFLGIYQVFSSENWTDVLYTATDSEMPLGQAAVVALFVTVWLLFANCTSMHLLRRQRTALRGIKLSYCRCSSPSSMRTSTSLKRPS